jgi:hypothetical protein
MKIAIVDTLYPEFLSTWPPFETLSYNAELRKLMSAGFGTFDAYSHWLRGLGHEAIDLIGNFDALQKLWFSRYANTVTGKSQQEMVLYQIETFEPDCVFMQDLSFFDPQQLQLLASQYLLAGQTSCRLPDTDSVSKFQILFSSFPFYPELLRTYGVRCEYLPLAFDPRMTPMETERDIDISFVGGVGAASHWRQGTETLESVAAAFGERFNWFGYGLENLSEGSPLRICYRGNAWGRQQYAVYGRSKCVVNRHGEIARGYTNTLRVYEASGCGAMVFTEESPNLKTLFPGGCVQPYDSAEDLCERLHYALSHDGIREMIARSGQKHTLAVHNYAVRMRTVSDVLQECLQARTVSR